MEPKESIVLYPSRGKGHLIPMVELAKLFVRHGFSATVVLIEVASDPSSATDPFFARVTSAYPSISFHRLPEITLSPSKPPIHALSESAALANPHLLHFLRRSTSSSDVRAIVLDIFCGAALEVASELRVPSYFFYTSCASTLALFLLFPALQTKLRELGGGPLRFPGLPPIPARDLPNDMLQPGEASHAIMSHFERWPRADGIIVNTFESLERRAVRALLDGGVRIPGRTLPPIYCIGPLIADRNEEGGKEGGEKHECLSWLDAQPEKSVVFLCFGSMGAFPAEQLREIATGLERSGQRFLWVVRSPAADPTKKFAPRPEPDLEALLPAGFSERTRGRGFVAKSWAPQTAVLAHESVGGFVSHCGWNSTLEAVSSGVPVIAWPLYAEQRINKVILVDEAEVAVAMDGYDEGLVRAEEVERKIRWLMASEEGRAMRDRMAATKERAVAARKEDGASTLAWSEVVKAIRKDDPDIGA